MDCSNGSELFQWQNGDSFLQNDSPLDISDLTWEGDTQDEDFSYILEETTPIKACGGSPHNFGYCGKRRKESDDECPVTSSRVKRCRTLQFDDEDLDLASLIDDHAFLKSKENIDVIDEVFPKTSQQGVGSQGIHMAQLIYCLTLQSSSILQLIHNLTYKLSVKCQWHLIQLQNKLSDLLEMLPSKVHNLTYKLRHRWPHSQFAHLALSNLQS